MTRPEGREERAERRAWSAFQRPSRRVGHAVHDASRISLPTAPTQMQGTLDREHTKFVWTAAVYRRFLVVFANSGGVESLPENHLRSSLDRLKSGDKSPHSKESPILGLAAFRQAKPDLRSLRSYSTKRRLLNDGDEDASSNEDTEQRQTMPSTLPADVRLRRS